MLINLNEFINHNTTVNIFLATIQNMAESPKCLYNVLITVVTAEPLQPAVSCSPPPSSAHREAAEASLPPTLIYTCWLTHGMSSIQHDVSSLLTTEASSLLQVCSTGTHVTQGESSWNPLPQGEPKVSKKTSPGVTSRQGARSSHGWEMVLPERNQESFQAERARKTSSKALGF